MSALDLAIVPLDVARRKTLLWMTRSALLTSILARRRARVAALATSQVVFFFVCAVVAPVAMFFVGPVTLGVPHLAADARYLILRRTLPKPFVALSVSSAAAIVVVRSLQLVGVVGSAADTLEAAAGGLWILSALAFAVRDRRTALRSAALLPPIGAVALLALRHAHAANIAMMHVHNIIGVLAWLLLYPRTKRWELLPVLCIVAALVFIGSGAAVAWTRSAGGDTAFGARMFMVEHYLAPGLSPRVAASLVVAFVFLQSVHYAIWLAWIPQEDLVGEGTPTFRMTVRGLRRDFGIFGCVVVFGTTVGLAVLALVRLGASLNWYLTLSRFHGLLELAVIAFLLVRGQDLSLVRAAPAARSVTAARP